MSNRQDYRVDDPCYLAWQALGVDFSLPEYPERQDIFSKRIPAIINTPRKEGRPCEIDVHGYINLCEARIIIGDDCKIVNVTLLSPVNLPTETLPDC